MKGKILLFMMTALLSVGAWAQSLQTVTIFENAGGTEVGYSASLSLNDAKQQLRSARVGSQLIITLSVPSAGANVYLYGGGYGYGDENRLWGGWQNEMNGSLSCILTAEAISAINNDEAGYGLWIGGGASFTVTKVTLNYNGLDYLYNAASFTPNKWDGSNGALQLDLTNASVGDVLAISFSKAGGKLWFLSGQGDPEALSDVATLVDNASITGTTYTIAYSVFNDIQVGESLEFTTNQNGIEATINTEDGAVVATNQYWTGATGKVTSDNIDAIKTNGIKVTVASGTTLTVKRKQDDINRPTIYETIEGYTTESPLYIPITETMKGYSGLYLSGDTYTASSINLIYKSAVNIADMSNGNVTTDKTKAAYGETVTLTPVPDGNYKISGAPTVTDENSASVTVTANGDGTYYFTMPATAVTVSATFTHNDNLTLSTGKILCFNSTGGRVTDTEPRYYTNSHTLWVGEGEHNGWDLTIGRIATTEEFSGVTISFTETQNIQLEIAYNDGSDKTYPQDLSSATSPVSINFSTAGITGVLKSIKFARVSSGDSKVAFTDEESVKMQIASEATYPTPRSSLKLTYETLMDSGNGSVTYGTEDKTFTITGGDDAHWAFWDFILPIPTELYNGIYFKLTKAPANSKIEIIYDGDGDNPQQVDITSETTYNVDFKKSGNVTRIRFAGAGTYEMGTCTAKPAKYQVTVSEAQYATFGDLGSPDVIDYSLATSSGLEAFIVTEYDSTTGNVKLTKVSKATANTAVVLYADINTSTSYTVQTAKAAGTEATSDNVDGNKLHISDGTVTVKENGSTTIYVLAKKGQQDVGFYKLAKDVKVPAGKAYLEISENSLQAPAFIGFGDGTTGISEELRVKSEEFATAQYYDLQGRRVTQPTKGMYIVNGKKVIIK